MSVLCSCVSGDSCLVTEGGRERGNVLCLTPAKEPVNNISLGGKSSRSRRTSIFCFWMAVPLLLAPSLLSLRLYRNFIISSASLDLINRSTRFNSFEFQNIFYAGRDRRQWLRTGYT